MKIVMVLGTFDFFHKGHINLLKQARKYGDYLIIVVARDKTVKKVKGAFSLNREDERLKTISQSGLADKVILGSLNDKYSAIKKYAPRVICLGYDQIFFVSNLRNNLNKLNLSETEIIRLKPYQPEIYKSSKLRAKMNLEFEDVAREINKHKNKKKSIILASFFKTGKGQYGEGDVFLGLAVPVSRQIASKYQETNFESLENLLKSEYHEYRLIGLLILIFKYEGGDEKDKKEVFEFYLKNLEAVNNWDLVDLTVPKIIGRYLWENKAESRKFLYDLVRSKNLWQRRIAILATFYFIKNKDFEDTLKIARILLKDEEDLIHKAVGWMLREMGKRNESFLIDFLDKHTLEMPRTMLRYAIEKLPPAKRLYYLKKK